VLGARRNGIDLSLGEFSWAVLSGKEGGKSGCIGGISDILDRWAG
jgi:hypothetical protein